MESSVKIKIALAGNPNCGKTTLFNILTGSNQYVGNWPGVTVEKKEGTLKGTYTEIRSGLTADDYVAFPYGKNVKPGAGTQEGDPSTLYNF